MASDKTPAKIGQDQHEIMAGTGWDDVEWNTVAQEAGNRITFDTIGDTFIGLFTGRRIVETEGKDGDPEKFTVLTWTGTDGEPYETNAGYSLEQAYADIEVGSITRTTYVKDVDVNQPSPMKSFRVEVAAPPRH